MRDKIYQDDWRYSALKPIVDWCTWNGYRKTCIHGKENIPTDGAILLTPNHCNTLMDALVILRTQRKQTVFGARADLFNNSFIAKLMFFVRILPMVRQRDGLRNVLKNKDTQETIVETLENNVRFCMYPEGTHRTKHSLQTLGKGVFRAALAANEKFGDKKPIYIVPVGIEYGDYFRYRSSALVNFGEAINVTEFIKGLDTDNEAQMMDALRKELAERMSQLITFIKADEKYDGKWALTKMVAMNRKRAYGEFGTDLYKEMTYNREIVAEIEAACENEPEKMEEILKDAAEFEVRRKKRGISLYSFKKKSSPVMSAVGKGFAALLGLPYFLFSAVASLPMWVANEIIRSKVRDKAFRNTVSLGVKLAMTLILFPTYAALGFCLAPWWAALAFMLLWLPSFGYFYDYIEGCRRWISDIRLLKNKKLYKEFKSILKKYKNL
jgi:1-acyl-sn-glycerol-3-phosphate acyltransferase